jgi:hypothetical protein
LSVKKKKNKHMKNKIRIYVEKGIPWDEQDIIARACCGKVDFNAVSNNTKVAPYLGWAEGLPYFWDNRQEVSYGVARKYWNNLIP